MQKIFIFILFNRHINATSNFAFGILILNKILIMKANKKLLSMNMQNAKKKIYMNL